jgi:hypothetical protein
VSGNAAWTHSYAYRAAARDFANKELESCQKLVLDLFGQRAELIKAQLPDTEEGPQLRQQRGTFRVVRNWLMVGAAITLAGGVLYAGAIANRSTEPAKAAAAPGDTKSYARVFVTMKANTPARVAAKACQKDSSTNIIDVEALLASSEDADAKQDGPFTVILTDGRCPMEVSVAQGQGSYRQAS